jgi:hypothetical protein
MADGTPKHYSSNKILYHFDPENTINDIALGVISEKEL